MLVELDLIISTQTKQEEGRYVRILLRRSNTIHALKTGVDLASNPRRQQTVQTFEVSEIAANMYGQTARKRTAIST